MPLDLPIIPFKTPSAWRSWLAKNHTQIPGIWMQIFKKDTHIKSITYAEALDEALCYGWIDGQKNKYDDTSWVQKFTPRRPRSKWSKINKDHVSRLEKAGKMEAAGRAAIEIAKQNGEWDSAYDSPSNTKIPEDFLKELEKYPKAQEFFYTLNKANIYAIAYRLQTAKKPETRVKRFNLILEMLKKGEKFH